MTYRLFLDDIRDPKWTYPNDINWVVCRSMNEAVALISVRGWPIEVSFDHDLGEDLNGHVPSGFDFAKYLVNLDLDTNSMPDNFSFKVHSANNAGADNINGLLNNYFLFR
jgi:hypothetical protein